MITMDSEWRSFAEVVLPPDVGADQQREMRRAFYAGALALLTGIMSNLSEGDEAEDQDIEMMDRLNAELIKFGEDVEAGRA